MKVSEPKFAPVVSPTKTDAPVRAVARAERVSTSQSAQIATVLESVKSNLPADRAARVRDIAAAVKKGQYQPDPQQIAEKIVDQAELEARLRAMLK
jgi:flagellar biosynthesis anti-sigma factor FlgM